MNKQNGFGVVGIVIILGVIGIIGFGGWRIWNSQKDQVSTNTTTAAKSAKSAESAKQAVANDSYLTITEWNIKLKLTDAAKNATYTVRTDNTYYKEVAFLSTKELDTSKVCQQYYGGEFPTFQYIARYQLEDQVSLDEGASSISALEATKQSPETYKAIGDSVYYFAHGNGMACPDANGAAVFSAYLAAFADLR